MVVSKLNKTLWERIFGRGCTRVVTFVMGMRDMWVVQWYNCIFEG